MKFVQFRLNNKDEIHIGVENDDGTVVDLSSSFPDCPRGLVEALAKHGSQGVINRATACLPGDCLDSSQFELLAPITSPDKVACVGMNYKDYCKQQGVPVPLEPVFFSKWASCIVGPFDSIPYPDVSEELDWEVELAIVIGKRGKNLDAETAKEHIFGFTVAHDVSARDWQLRKNGGQWLLGKAMDAFCPMGPRIVTADEIPDPHNLTLKCRVNGQVKQSSNTSQLVHGAYDCIAWLSKFCTLLPGDVILTGTPPGVGLFTKPPEFLKRGDVVECEVEKIGVIRNTIV